MAKEIPSVGDMRRKSEVSDDEIEAASAAYLEDENTKPFAFKSGHTFDVAKAIEVHPQAKKLLADKDTASSLRRMMATTAVIIGSRSRTETPKSFSTRITLPGGDLWPRT